MRVYTAPYIESDPLLHVDRGSRGFVFAGHAQMVQGRTVPGAIPVRAAHLKAVLEELQQQIPLHWCADLDIYCLPWSAGVPLLSGWGDIPAQTWRTHIVFSAGDWPDEYLRDTLAHELAHVLDLRLLGEELRHQGMAILGLDPAQYPEDAQMWLTRQHEIMGEYISAALWGREVAPVQEGIVHVSLDRIAALREWLFGLMGRGDPVPVEIVGRDAGEMEIVMRVGQRWYEVNGDTRMMDVAPFIRDDRCFVPIRFVAEALGCDVEWFDGKVTIRKAG